jgi:hypothetical protein
MFLLKESILLIKGFISRSSKFLRDFLKNIISCLNLNIKLSYYCFLDASPSINFKLLIIFLSKNSK